MQGAWALLLSRYSGEEDVVFGAAVSGRPPELAGVEAMVGMFINTLPVRVRVAPEMPVREWLARIQAAAAELRGHENSPLVQVQKWSGVPAGLPLFESILAFENYPLDAVLDGEAHEFAVERWVGYTRGHYPLSLVVIPDGRLAFSLEYDGSRFDAGACDRMLQHMQVLLDGLAADPARALSGLPLLVGSERERVLVDWNRTAAEYPRACIHELFSEQASRTPHAPAVVTGTEEVTYTELEARANRLGHHLRKLGVGPEVRVGVCLERSTELVVSLLGVLKAGGAYVPLDPAYPPQRLDFMLRDASVPLVVTESGLVDRLPDPGTRVVRVDADADRIASEPATPPDAGVGPESLAYVIYTSGSTGTPKGVMVRHRGAWETSSRHGAAPPRGAAGRPGAAVRGRPASTRRCSRLRTGAGYGRAAGPPPARRPRSRVAELLRLERGGGQGHRRHSFLRRAALLDRAAPADLPDLRLVTVARRRTVRAELAGPVVRPAGGSSTCTGPPRRRSGVPSRRSARARSAAR